MVDKKSISEEFLKEIATEGLENYAEGYKEGFRDGYQAAVADVKNSMKLKVTKMADGEGVDPLFGISWWW